MSFDRKYLLWALSYGVLGMGVGIYMAASHNHVQHVTHAHILLVGFVVSLMYAVIHKLWLAERPSRLATTQFILHHAAAITMFSGLGLLYGNVVAPQTLEPILALSSIGVLVGIALMFVMVLRSRPAPVPNSTR